MPFEDLADAIGHLAVFFRDDVAFIMRSESDHYPVPDIGPVRMMILSFGKDRHLRHESPCLGKIFEDEFADEFIIFFCPVHHLIVPISIDPVP